MTEEVVVVDDRRAALSAAFDAAETAESEAVKTTTEEPKGGHVEPKSTGPDTPPPSKTDVPNDALGSKSTQSIDAAPKPEIDKVLQAPQSWKPAQKAKWDKLDPDIQQEVLRRDRETTQVLNDTTQARQIATKFSQTVQPYMARIQSLNTDPLTAVHELLKADHMLTTAPKAARAQFMAKLITDYGVDLQELDNALSGKPEADPVDARVEALLQQRLAPIQQFLTQQQQAEQQRQQETTQQLAHTVTTMSQDSKYPYFEQVRESMADIVEIMANRGQHITIEAAYNRAVAMDPAISSEIATKTAQQAQVAQAAQQTSRAQRALQASVSVGGAPSGLATGAPSANDRRAAIAAAFEQAEGR